jgi:phosphotriesterase-related protein
METVSTVRGPIKLDALGRTLMHEHIYILDPEAFQNYKHFWGQSYWDEDAALADATAKLGALKQTGIRTLVDATVIGLGRCIPRIQRLNAGVDINIIVATGIYAYLELPHFFRFRPAHALAQFFVREINEGIDDTGVRAAFIKCAVDKDGVVGDVPRILRAAAIASVETGAPIMVHTNAAAKTGLVALDALVEAGADPSKVVIAHAGDSSDLSYLRALLQRGAFVGCDRFGDEFLASTEQRVSTVVNLVHEGYANRIHLSHDSACFMDFAIGDERFREVRKDHLLIPETILPAMIEAGVTPEQLDAMLIRSAVEYFGSGSP